jgi:WD40 repeat protein
VLQWTTRRASPALILELGRSVGWVAAVAVLPDGRVVSGGGPDGRVLVWDPDDPGTGPVELGCHGGLVEVTAVAVLPDGRVVSSAGDRVGRVLVWDPGNPRAGPVELGGHEGGVGALAVLPDGRLASAGWDWRVRLWDMQSIRTTSLLACSASVLVTSPSPSGANLLIGHAAGGISCWELRAAAQSTPETRQRAR